MDCSEMRSKAKFKARRVILQSDTRSSKCANPSHTERPSQLPLLAPNTLRRIGWGRTTCRRSQGWENPRTFVLARSIVARLLARQLAAWKRLQAWFPTRWFAKARVMPVHRHTMGSAFLLHGDGTWRAFAPLRVACVIRRVAAGTRDDARVVAGRWRRTTWNRRVQHSSAAAAIQWIVTGVCAWWTHPLVAEAAAYMNSAWCLLLAL